MLSISTSCSRKRGAKQVRSLVKDGEEEFTLRILLHSVVTQLMRNEVIGRKTSLMFPPLFSKGYLCGFWFRDLATSLHVLRKIRPCFSDISQLRVIYLTKFGLLFSHYLINQIFIKYTMCECIFHFNCG